MNKIIFILCAVICICMLSGAIYAETLEVEKSVENSDISVGDDVKILLKFKNPFDTNVKIQIVDKNVFGNNGLDIQCYEHTLPAGMQVIAYEPIKPFAPGNYTLDEAQIKYTNPKTGVEETIESNKLNLTVKDSRQQMQGQQSITNLYQCGGMSMKSTTYSSSSTQQQQKQEEQNSPENRAQNNQMNQNTQDLKKQINEEMQKQKQMQEEFNKNIRNNTEFQDMAEKLSDAGYNLTDSELKPTDNNTGEFEFSYQKNNKTAGIKGRMENRTMKELMSQSDEDREKMRDSLMKNKEFQEYNKKLAEEGFNMTGVNFTQISQNHTKIEVSYERSETNLTNLTKQAKITAEYKNGEIKDVRLEDGEKNENNNSWLILIAAVILILIVFYYFKVRKQKDTKESKTPAEQETGKNYVEVAAEMLALAQELFNNNCEKDAYEKVSQAIRFYFSHKLEIKKEITNYELLDILGRDEIKREVKKCLDLCALVEFAKYKANKDDFDEIIGLAEKIIK